MSSVIQYRVSVDCAVFGFDGQRMNVLLYRMMTEDENFNSMKLPGALIHEDESLDDAAARVLEELTGLKDVNLTAFRAFGSPTRMSNPRDRRWVQNWEHLEIKRAITASYIAAIRIDSKTKVPDGFQALWMPIEELPNLAFDHNQIVKEAFATVKTLASTDANMLFSLLPEKFTADQLRRLTNIIRGKNVDARNFYKHLANKPYIKQLEEKQSGVAHRAARYYSFDGEVYNKTKEW